MILRPSLHTFSIIPYYRFLTYSYLWVFNLQALACPSVLSYDWQLGSVPLVTSGLDPRLVLTGLAALVSLALLRTLVTHHSRSHRDNVRAMGGGGQILQFADKLAQNEFIPFNYSPPFI